VYSCIRILIVFVCMAGLVIACDAQYVSNYDLNLQTGLPSNRVYSLLADKQGYLWIATDKGIA